MDKLISIDLLNRVASALASMTGLSYVQINQLLQEIGQLSDGVVAPKEEEKKIEK
jgi:hypothetical protein